MRKYGYLCVFVCLFSAIFSLNSQAYDTIDIDYDCGDYAFFHSDYLSDKGDVYYKTTFTDKGNTITAHRLTERYNPDRTSSEIEFDKTQTDDCHMDINTTEKKFSYYVIRGYFKMDSFGPTVNTAVIRQKATDETPQTDEDIVRINSAGELLLKDTKTVIGRLTEGEYTYIEMYCDLISHKATVRIDGKKVSAELSLDSSINQIDMVRIWLHDSAAGKLTVDEYEVLGLEKPYSSGGDTNWSSVFHTDDGIKEYLSDKIAFQVYGKTVMAGGVKYHINPSPVFDKEADELYIPAQAMSLAFGIELTADGETLYSDDTEFTANSKTVKYDGESYTLAKAPFYEGGNLYIPLKELVKKILKYQIVCDDGMILISEGSNINLDFANLIPDIQNTENVYKESYIKSLNRFLFFERPSAEEIESLFESNNENNSHPRIFGSRKRFEELAKQCETDEYLNNMVRSIISAADGYLGEETVKYEILSNQRLLEQARALKEKMEYLGLAYQLTGDRKYAQQAWKEFEACGTFPDWNPSHMIDVGELMAAYAIGYDLMYNEFSAAQREYISRTVFEKGINVTRLAYYGRLAGGSQYADSSDRFVKMKSNFNTVINGGAIAAALAFLEYDSDVCCDVLEKAIRSLEYTFIGFGPDGAWQEGLGYWDYTMSYLSIGIESMMNVLGSNFGMMNFAGMDNTGYFFKILDSYCGVNAFHDIDNGRAYSSALTWIAKVFDQPDIAAIRKNQQTKTVLDIYDILWYGLSEEGREENFPLDMRIGGIEAFSARSSYTDNNGMYLSAHGGSVRGYHAHADAGTFVYDNLGIRWACDLGKEDYDVQQSTSESYYSAYRRRAEAHNVVVINPDTSTSYGGQEADGYAGMTDFATDGKKMYCVYDMTSVYGNVSDYKRGFFVDEDRSDAIIRDEITLTEESEIDWFMTTGATPSISGNTVTLTKDGKTAYLKFSADVDFDLEITDASPLLGEPVLEGQNTNDGYKRIRFVTTASGQVNITAQLSTDKESTITESPINEWEYIIDGEPSFKTEQIFRIKEFATGINNRKSDFFENGTLNVSANLGVKKYNSQVSIVCEVYKDGKVSTADKKVFELYEREDVKNLVQERFFDISADFNIEEADENTAVKVYILSDTGEILAEKTLEYKPWRLWINKFKKGSI